MPATALHPIKLRWFLWTPLGLALFVIIGFYSVQMTQNYNSFEDKRAAARYETLTKLRADEKAILTTADWVDQGKKIVRIPIDEAMAEEIDVLKAKPATVGALIPVINAAPAASTSNTAPAASSSNNAPATSSTNTPPATNAAPAASSTNTSYDTVHFQSEFETVNNNAPAAPVASANH